MINRLFIASGLLIAGVAGVCVAFAFSRIVPDANAFPGSSIYCLLFRPAAWVIPLSAFLGIFFRALNKDGQGEPSFKNSKILRHDKHMFFGHWAHAFSVLVLAVSGMVMGPFFLPRWVHTPQDAGFVLNLHFIGIIVFVFSLFYAISNTVITGGLKDLLPEANDLKAAISDYRSKFGKGSHPGHGKYLASEKLAYPLWVILVGGITITGGVKVAAHVWLLPSALMGTMTFIHDGCAAGLLVLLAVHIILGAVVPWSWPLFGSMVTGYISEAYVRKKHRHWYEALQKPKTAS